MEQFCERCTNWCSDATLRAPAFALSIPQTVQRRDAKGRVATPFIVLETAPSQFAEHESPAPTGPHPAGRHPSNNGRPNAELCWHCDEKLQVARLGGGADAQQQGPSEEWRRAELHRAKDGPKQRVYTKRRVSAGTRPMRRFAGRMYGFAGPG